MRERLVQDLLRRRQRISTEVRVLQGKSLQGLEPTRAIKNQRQLEVGETTVVDKDHIQQPPVTQEALTHGSANTFTHVVVLQNEGLLVDLLQDWQRNAL